MILIEVEDRFVTALAQASAESGFHPSNLMGETFEFVKAFLDALFVNGDLAELLMGHVGGSADDTVFGGRHFSNIKLHF